MKAGPAVAPRRPGAIAKNLVGVAIAATVLVIGAGADMETAKAINPAIEKAFARYGVTEG